MSDEETREPKAEKKGGGKTLPWLLVVLLLCVLGLAYHLFWPRVEAADALANESSDQKARIAELEKEMAGLKASKDELAKDVAAKASELEKLKGTYDALQENMKAEIAKGDVSLTQSGGKLQVDLVDKVLFDSGEAEISTRGQEILMRVGQVLSKIDDKQIQVSGHTDDAPISDRLVAKFPTNWELSSARAVNVVRFLNEEAKVPGRRLVASGYGPFHPISSNATPQGRARNRRIEILLTPVIESVKDRELAAQVAAVRVPAKKASAPAHKATVAKAVKPSPKVVPAKAVRQATHLSGKRTTTTAKRRK